MNGLEARDRYVVGEARRRAIPIASALGGGYGADQREVANRHAASMLAIVPLNFLELSVISHPDTMQVFFILVSIFFCCRFVEEKHG